MEPDDIWLAGLYEGEGTLVGPSDRGSWALAITMVDEDVVRRAHHVAGVGTVTSVRRSKATWSDQWRFRACSHSDIAMLLERLLPQLGARRRARAEEFLTWHRAGGYRDVSPEVRAADIARMRAYRARQRASKQLETVT